MDGVSYKGDPVRGIKGFHISDITSAEECQQECVQDSDCQFWTWNSPDFKKNPNTCWLKAGKGKTKEVAGKISGPKICK